MSMAMSAFTPRAMPDDLARLYVLEATIEILKTESACAPIGSQRRKEPPTQYFFPIICLNRS
jgi:hypothetical protein